MQRTEMTNTDSTITVYLLLLNVIVLKVPSCSPVCFRTEKVLCFVFYMLSFPRKTSDDSHPSRSQSWHSSYCLMFCDTHTSHHQWGPAQLETAGCLGNNFHHYSKGCWRRWGQKHNRYCHLLAWQAKTFTVTITQKSLCCWIQKLWRIITLKDLKKKKALQ